MTSRREFLIGTGIGLASLSTAYLAHAQNDPNSRNLIGQKVSPGGEGLGRPLVARSRLLPGTSPATGRRASRLSGSSGGRSAPAAAASSAMAGSRSGSSTLPPISHASARVELC